MKVDIILAGVGGQGILSIATVLGYAAVESGLFVKQAEVHGMSQRGGDVQSHFRISDKPIFSDLVPKGKADLIVSVEPMESLRYLPYLSKDGWLVTNTNPVVNITNYPQMESVMAQIRKLPHHIAIDGDKIARDVNNLKGMNMVLAGAASVFIDLDFELMKKGIEVIFGKKGEELVKSNIAALTAGREFSEKNR
ncbi:MAG TPA: indolepyruvate oxidoreductase subunit beta [bacterium]|nr:indolepyruvate oxidoreductase subunit beta [bacterium]HQI06151.1 indolepyruvate oxidoreductase subunit beta [bacterium]HQO93148.1 indolepyruvate oxidoreductase subunit beta [bacterium]